ncbi:NAD(P)-dependent dehydrogenase (short-subunit alcohol dehydrogenase family) [Chryseobacterium sediminis]|uniref:NAD(P)-dependent dehydrogenase (Short-subunit alcohol dehydrogenase family) n=1 Tax=Chryseobacterium sediminis TaxID=1679494 RepID=A0ABR6Q0I6_9FLAO|nr:SDR family oxidoreductase [Chryseobacterium sediminis]MBB6330019.1 NAD(P)-dependent dehydrogenase (short-subunit alcohol dehydrogenase family) [Chryseobacterium sediminis]
MGGSSGLGLATAKAASAEGAKVIIVSSNQERINNALEHLPNATGHALDLSVEENFKSLFERIGNIDHLVYTAGENLSLNFLSETDLQESRDFFTLRYWGALTAIKYAAPMMNTEGSINLISGIANQRPGSGWALASSICGAVNGLVRAAAVELAPIRVNAVSPGVIKTNLWNNMTEEQRADFYNGIGQSSLLKRVGNAEDIADAFMFLMKEKFITGQIITVDGGSVLV